MDPGKILTAGFQELFKKGLCVRILIEYLPGNNPVPKSAEVQHATVNSNILADKILEHFAQISSIFNNTP